MTIASYAGLGGLGRIITSGIGLNDYERILGGALLVTALALLVAGLFALAQRAATTPGMSEHPRANLRGNPRTLLSAARRRTGDSATSSRSPRPHARTNA